MRRSRQTRLEPLGGESLDALVLLRQRGRSRVVLGSPRPLYFYRGQENREVDFVVDRGGRLTLIECRLTERPSAWDAVGLDSDATVQCRNPNLEIERRVIVARPFEDHRLAAE